MSDKEYHNVNHRETYEATEPNDSNYFSTLLFMNVTPAQKEDRGYKAGSFAFCRLPSVATPSVKIFSVALLTTLRNGLMFSGAH